MLRLVLLTLVVFLPTRGAAQAGEAVRKDPPGTRSYSIAAGVGTSMGWYGAQAERYFREAGVSVLVGLGYAHPPEEGHPAGPAFAVGARRFRGGGNHRGFVELSVAQLATSASHLNGELVKSGRHYGPAVLVGYQPVSDGGFTVIAALGLGYAPGLSGGGDHAVTPALNLGLGYTWR